MKTIDNIFSCVTILSTGTHEVIIDHFQDPILQRGKMKEEKKHVQRGVNYGKRGKPPAEWVLTLKNKKYDVNELINISKKSSSSVRKVMSKYAIKIEYCIQDNGKSSVVYTWDQDHFLKIFYESK